MRIRVHRLLGLFLVVVALSSFFRSDRIGSNLVNRLVQEANLVNLRFDLLSNQVSIMNQGLLERIDSLEKMTKSMMIKKSSDLSNELNELELFPCVYQQCQVLKREGREIETITRFNFREACSIDRDSYWVCYPTYDSKTDHSWEILVTLQIGSIQQVIQVPLGSDEKVTPVREFVKGSFVDCLVDSFGKISLP